MLIPKPKKRKPQISILIFAEGARDEIFIKHLNTLYSRDNDYNIKIDSGQGGTPTEIVKGCINYPGIYEERIVVFDNDKSEIEMVAGRELARENGVKVLEQSPCLEGQLLEILKPGKDYSTKSSKECKKQFEKEFIDGRKATDIREYQKILTKKIIEDARKKSDYLKKIIKCIEQIN